MGKYKYAVEFSLYKLEDTYADNWTTWSKYKTQRAMLQGLKQLRLNNKKNSLKSSSDGGKTWIKIYTKFRPIHY